MVQSNLHQLKTWNKSNQIFYKDLIMTVLSMALENSTFQGTPFGYYA